MKQQLLQKGKNSERRYEIISLNCSINYTPIIKFIADIDKTISVALLEPRFIKEEFSLGPMGGQVNFTVALRPNVTSGNYTIKRTVDIDPNGVWNNYGQDLIGTVEIKEDSDTQGIAVGSAEGSSEGSSNSGNSVTNVYNTYVTNENNKPTNNSLTIGSEDKNNKASSSTIGITGGVIGVLISKVNFIVMITIVGLVLIAFIISNTIIKLKKK